MTRRDFKMISKTLAGAKPVQRNDQHGYATPTSAAEQGTWAQIVLAFAAVLGRLPAFERDVFLKACGYKEEDRLP